MPLGLRVWVQRRPERRDSGHRRSMSVGGGGVSGVVGSQIQEGALCPHRRWGSQIFSELLIEATDHTGFNTHWQESCPHP